MTVVPCPEPEGMVEERIDRVLTQYRESPKLIHILRTYLRQVEDVALASCSLPEHFDLDHAVGEQLDFLGRRLGWPRCHCVCDARPVFGFSCAGVSSDFPLVGFCDDSTWLDCGEFGTADICLNDDDVYRSFLKARRYQMLGLFDLDSLTAALRDLWGPTASVLEAGGLRVVLSPGRELSDYEVSVLQLVPRVLPLAPGVHARFHFGTVMPVFGFGEGWGCFCETQYDNLPLSTEDSTLLTTEGGEVLSTGPITVGAEWMCEIDVRPYDC